MNDVDHGPTHLPVTLVVGSDGDGVTDHGRRCAVAAGTRWIRWAPPSAATGSRPSPTAPEDLPPAGHPVHVHVTDRLFGPDPTDAVGAIRALAGRHPVGLTLHDVPQPAEGEQRYRRRAAVYRDIAGAASQVVVSSEHERALCRRIGGIDVTAVIPLPIPELAPGTDSDSGAGAPEPADAPSVGIFGYIHPGKGVDLVVEAMIDSGIRATVRLLGRPADGHRRWVDDLTVRAAGHGVDVRVSGYLADSELWSALRRVTVPVSAFRNVSASGSLNTWIAAGRRPLVLPSAYTLETERRWPGSLIVSPAQQLGGSLAELLAEPAPTWRHTDPPRWGWAEVGRAHRRLWEHS